MGGWERWARQGTRYSYIYAREGTGVEEDSGMDGLRQARDNSILQWFIGAAREGDDISSDIRDRWSCGNCACLRFLLSLCMPLWVMNFSRNSRVQKGEGFFITKFNCVSQSRARGLFLIKRSSAYALLPCKARVWLKNFKRNNRSNYKQPAHGQVFNYTRHSTEIWFYTRRGVFLIKWRVN